MSKPYNAWLMAFALCAGITAWLALTRFPVDAQQQLASVPRPGEFDTAAYAGGQAGGTGDSVGLAYQRVDLRCGSGQVIVGANLRRGDALDYLQVACATPSCGSGSCQWSSYNWGPSAGNPYGGDPYPSMLCGQTEMFSGFRARVVTFFYRTLEYAEDIEIECAPMTSSPTTQGFYPVAKAVRGIASGLHHPQGGLSTDTILPRWNSTYLTKLISCRPRGWGSTGFALGVSSFVSSRVVQAVSLYCPSGQPQAPRIDRCVDMANDALHLEVDAQLRGASQHSYNCFHYLRTFIEGTPPSSMLPLFWWNSPNSSEIEGPKWPMNYEYLESQGYVRIDESRSLETFQAAVGDLITVENLPSDQHDFPYLHGAIVVEVSGNGQIVRLRQKTNVQQCVRDLDPVTFMTKYYGLLPGYQYELWRDTNRQGLPQSQ